VKAVVHSHSEAIVPYSISGVELRACYHMAGFLGSGVPVWDIAEWYREGDVRDMLVRDRRLGASLARCFSQTLGAEESQMGSDRADDEKKVNLPYHAVVLMRGHGLTVVAESIEDVVLRAIYTQKNALIQTTALTTSLAAHGAGSGERIRYLSEEEARAATEMTKSSAQRPWKLWRREVESCPLYVSSAKSEY
jgi:ribulose-5-phosphate 4-epimerase/fuculose-1-phosphate aldolase